MMMISRLIDNVKDFFNRIVFWWNFFKGSFSNEEVLFIDGLYTKGVEAYAWAGKNKTLFVSSKHYRRGWSDFKVYEKRVNPTLEERPDFLKQYVTGVAVAYVHGTMLWNERIAQDIMEDKKASGKEFFAGATEHIKAGFKNAMTIMNKQHDLMQNDLTVQRIKKIHEARSVCAKKPIISKSGFILKNLRKEISK